MNESNNTNPSEEGIDLTHVALNRPPAAPLTETWLPESALTRLVVRCSFGLVRTPRQAQLVMGVLVLGIFVGAVYILLSGNVLPQEQRPFPTTPLNYTK